MDYKDPDCNSRVKSNDKNNFNKARKKVLNFEGVRDESEYIELCNTIEKGFSEINIKNWKNTKMELSETGASILSQKQLEEFILTACDILEIPDLSVDLSNIILDCINIASSVFKAKFLVIDSFLRVINCLTFHLLSCTNKHSVQSISQILIRLANNLDDIKDESCSQIVGSLVDKYYSLSADPTFGSDIVVNCISIMISRLHRIDEDVLKKSSAVFMSRVECQNWSTTVSALNGLSEICIKCSNAVLRGFENGFIQTMFSRCNGNEALIVEFCRLFILMKDTLENIEEDLFEAIDVIGLFLKWNDEVSEVGQKAMIDCVCSLAKISQSVLDSTIQRDFIGCFPDASIKVKESIIVLLDTLIECGVPTKVIGVERFWDTINDMCETGDTGAGISALKIILKIATEGKCSLNGDDEHLAVVFDVEDVIDGDNEEAEGIAEQIYSILQPPDLNIK